MWIDHVKPGDDDDQEDWNIDYFGKNKGKGKSKGKGKGKKGNGKFKG